MPARMAGAEKYQLGERLGGGGMAEVFRAAVIGAQGFSRPVAIKRVLPGFSEDPAFASMFVNEARLSSLLAHPNVVSVLDFDTDPEGRLFLVMELVPGVDLAGLGTTGALPFSVVIHVVAEMLRGLGYAHELTVDGKHLGIVHRDISPHNVLLSWDGAVKVSDFGIAKAFAASSATDSGMLKGKVAYMSPEQAHLQPLDGRSDLFAVGIILHELLCGQRLFGAGTMAEVFARLLTQPIDPPSHFRPEVPADLDRVTMALLERDRERRSPTATHALDELIACRDASARGRDELTALMVARFSDRAPVRAPRWNTTPPPAYAAGLSPASRSPAAAETARLGVDPAPIPAATLAAGPNPAPQGAPGVQPATHVLPEPGAPASTRTTPPRRGVPPWMLGLAATLVVVAASVLVIVLLAGPDEAPAVSEGLDGGTADAAAMRAAAFDARAAAGNDAGVAAVDATVESSTRGAADDTRPERRPPVPSSDPDPRTGEAEWNIDLGGQSPDEIPIGER